MEKIISALEKIEAVLNAVDAFQEHVSSGDFEKRLYTRWPDIKGGLEAVLTMKGELQKIQTAIEKQNADGIKK